MVRQCRRRPHGKIGARSKTLTRILTDPATGTPIDAKATTYRIPSDVRKTLVAKWAICTVPGCNRRAEKSEIDHIIPFDHDHPDQGGDSLASATCIHCAKNTMR